MKASLPALLAAALLGASLPAAAHGHQDHGKAAAVPVAPQQQPWGIAGDAAKATRTIEIRMTDAMRFSPAHIEVKQGETVRFRVRNDGKLMHEMVIGTKKALDEHAVLMVRFPNMEHDEPHMAHVASGKAGELVWTFNRAGDFHFACLVAGHYQAGMVGTIRVAGRQR